MVSPRNIRFVLALLVTTAIVGIVTAISLKGSRTASPEPVSPQLPQNIDVALQNARFTETSEGTIVWELDARRAEYDKTGDVVYLTDIHMVYAKSRTNGSITVTAAKGAYSNVSKNIQLRGRVHVMTESGMTFDTTRWITWVGLHCFGLPSTWSFVTSGFHWQPPGWNFMQEQKNHDF